MKKKLEKDKRPHGRHGQPDEPSPKDSCHDEDDVVNAIAPNRHYYRPIPGDLDESVTGIGGRNPSSDDPGLLDDESVGHLTLDEKDDEELEESQIRFESASGVVYSGKVIGVSRRYLIIEMGGSKVAVLKSNPTIRVEKAK